MLICFSQKQNVISKLRAFANKGKFMLFNSICWNWEVFWETGGGVCRALPPQSCHSPEQAFVGNGEQLIPHASFWSLNLSMAFICAKIKYETYWEVANWKTPAYKKTPVSRASARRWEVELKPFLRWNIPLPSDQHNLTRGGKKKRQHFCMDNL